MSNIVQIKVPDIGDFKEVEVIEVLVSVGDTIKAEQSLITVESDKASMEIPTSQGGVVKSISVKVGDKVAEGTVVLEVEAAGAAAAPAAPAAAPAAAAPAKAAEAAKPAAAAAPAPAASAGPVEIQVPDIGDFKEVEVIEVMVAVGDTIKAEQSLITVESDKASMEIPTRRAAWSEVKVKVGDKVAKGSVVVVVEGSAPAAAAAARCRPAPRRERRGAGTGGSAAPAARPAPAAALEDANLKPGQLPHASPSVRKFARELGVNLSKVKGSGPRTASRPTTCAPSSSRRWPLRPPSPAVRPTAPRWASCRGPRSTSPSSARSKPSRCRASRRSPARTCIATGS